ncbi:Extender of the chronological lifespan protein 1 [Frankliniella fusca]|uniref:Extender of the chronological lifespan protein 1 n=1 Tax=Frankliniella fusca TaxID=407009 RepID=A0AAE1I055_9NEOP|nr:Extender of the chronological lifespan protein 1 [Frankliniella fusca]
MGYPNPTFFQVNRLLFSYYSVVKYMVQNLKYQYLISLHLAHYQEKSYCSIDAVQESLTAAFPLQKIVSGRLIVAVHSTIWLAVCQAFIWDP